ncbi:protein kinase domain-containing protein [Myxococcus qinghaiensis]|uniref:protein kinase domain-containing protein n=1 Tax=Myxococcus qinghaiensis TaxID=2906758 RepID=UPI0020A779D7|nr:protein kinase [Myxococcus qinghaiensis]MCP3167005.1 protein kinase [Myxococcus qinghaiensis]
MGEVYLGEQVSLGRKVAIKVLHHDLHAQPGMAERFKREARLLSAVEHPAVVHIVDFGESGDHACLVMEFVEGESLYDVLTRGPMAPGRALPLLQQLAEGLAAIHDKGIIHRDLKPENVFISPGARGEQARLLDFGIARLVEPDAQSNVSQVGVVLGTPEYLSPEQAVGAKVDTRSDLYCFGVLIYRVLSGRLPFEGPQARHFLAQHASHAPLPLDRAAPSLTRYIGLLSLVMRLLEKNPAKRPQSAHELADALAAAHSALSAFTPGLGTPAYVGAPATTTTPSGTSVFGAGEATNTAGPSGTSVFGAADAAPAPLPSRTSQSTAAFGLASSPGMDSASPSAMRTGTAAFGTRPTLSGSTSTVKPQNLTVMLTDIQGFTERTSRQTHEENARMLETHDRLLMPLVREHEGRLVQKRGDALLVAFRSPTAGVLCGMAMQDRLWRHNEALPAEERLHVRVCLHAGEVLLTADTVLGEPMEVLETVEHVAAAGQVTFTEAVNLARNRAEAEVEPCGSITLPGREEQLQLYRCQQAAEGPPFGARFEKQNALAVRLAPAVQRTRAAMAPLSRGMRAISSAVRAGKARLGTSLTRLNAVLTVPPGVKTGVSKVVVLARAKPRAAMAVLGAVVLLSGGVAVVLHLSSPAVRAMALLQEGKKDEALALLNETSNEEQKQAPVRRALAATHHALGNHDKERVLLTSLDPEGRASVEDSLLDGLAEDFGRLDNEDLRKLLANLPKERVHPYFGDLIQGEYSPKQWGALRYLDFAKLTDGVDLVSAYSKALESKDCGVRKLAARRLGALGNMDAVPALIRLAELKDAKAGDCGQSEADRAIKTLNKKGG